MKLLKRLVTALLCAPLLLVAAYLALQLVGMAVNHAATARQTEALTCALQKELPSARILSVYSQTGNTTGTGNHVDMLSVALFKTPEGIGEVRQKLSPYYDFTDPACCLSPAPTGGQAKPPFWAQLDAPGDLGGCYLLYINKSAPFADNIEGH